MRTLVYAAVVAALVCSTQALSAQQVSGHIHESSSAQPVPGAVVNLLDAAGKTITRTVSNAAGAYHLAGNGQGRSLSVIRIGFRPATQPLAATPDNGAQVVDVAMTMLPMVLEAVAVHDQARCPVTADGPAAFALWDQARNALLAEIVSREVNPATVRFVTYARRLDPSNTMVQKQAVDDSEFVASRAFVSARTAREFADRGYRDAPDSIRRTYYAPDGDVLLDSAFLRAHCISLRDHDGDHKDQIGIAFKPVAGQDSLVDIAGVLWLAQGTPALRTLDFQFTNLTPQEMRARAGGTVTFSEMPNGISMISSWKLHTPVLLRQTTRIGQETITIPTEGPGAIAGYNDIGSELTNASWADGTTWRDSLPTVSGRVVATGSERPMAYARVRFRDTHITAEADSMGEFVLPSIVSGHYSIEANDGLLAQLGMMLTGSADVVVAENKAPVSGVKIVLPSRAREVSAWCSKAVLPSGTPPSDDKLIVGTVFGPTGKPVEGATVLAEWNRKGSAPDQKTDFRGVTNAQGTFAMCGMPPGTPIDFLAARGATIGNPVTIKVDSLSLAAPVRLVLPDGVGSRPHHRQ
ncbi:MAG TPA: carboxypeptidase-like regulatory domain-containing protein [Gemmatimonadaceae bacterium]|jgi:hypothetical protein